MVIGIDESPKPSQDQSTLVTRRLAQPRRRLAAFIVDHFIVLPPLIYFLMAPMESRFRDAIQMGQDYRAALLMLLMFVFATFFVFSYHLVCNLFYGKTIGQHFLGIRVVDYESGKALTPMAALLRSFGFILNSFLFFAGSLSLFSHTQRRAFYDLISESIVLSNDAESAESPSELSSFAARCFLASIAFIITSFFLGSIYLALSRPLDQSALIESLEEEGQLCHAVSAAAEEWPSEDGEDVSRLGVAVALYFSGEIDTECLQAEVNPKLMLLSEDAMFYLTKSLLYENEEDLAGSYSEASCEQDKRSVQCELSRLMKSVKAYDWSGITVAKEKRDQSASKSPVYFRVWLAQQLVDLGQYDLASEFINSLPNSQSLAAEKSFLKIKTYIGLNQLSEAKGALEVSSSYLTNSEYGELLGVMCKTQLDKGCASALESACTDYTDWVEASADSLNMEQSIVYVENSICKKTSSALMQSSTMSLMHSDVRKLLKAINSREPQRLVSLVDNAEISPKIRSVAMLKLLKHWPSTENMIRAELMGSKVQPGSEEIAKSLLEKWTNSRNFKKIVSFLNLKKKKWGELDVNSLKHLVVAEYHMGKITKARNYLAQVLDKSEQEPRQDNNNRQPASIDSLENDSPMSFDEEYDLIIQDL